MPDEDITIEYLIRRFSEPKILLLSNVLLWIGVIILALIMEMNFNKIEQTINDAFNDPVRLKYLPGNFTTIELK